MSTLKANKYQHVDRSSPSIEINSDGSVSIASTVTYEDVTSVDSVGLITARSGIDVVTNGVNIQAGILTAKNIIDASDAQRNTRVGTNAGDSFSGTDAVDNTLIGYDAGTAVTTGDQNTALGSYALAVNTTAGNNTALGFSALKTNTTGTNNTCLGYGAGSTNTTGGSNIYVGKDAAGSSASVSVESVFGVGITGKGSQTTFLGGTSGTYNNKNVTTFETTSDERIKKNIVDNNSGLDILNQIQIRNFEYRTEEEIVDFDNPKAAVVEQEGLQLGVIAQEIEKILPEVVTTQSTGVKSVNSDNLTWYLVNAVKELSTKVTALENA